MVVKKQKVFQEVVSHFPHPAVQRTHWRGGRPGGSDAWVPLSSVGNRFVYLFIQVGQDSQMTARLPPKCFVKRQPVRRNRQNTSFQSPQVTLAARDRLHQCPQPHKAPWLFSSKKNKTTKNTLRYLNQCQILSLHKSFLKKKELMFTNFVTRDCN